ncbi:MAG: LTA synthase family protein [SAR324 cluster bacterium]|nr:LTA synthase family protein [SAR324 cluster bacterium]
MRKILTPRVRFLVAVLLLNVALLAALRAIFLAVFLQSETPLGSGTLLKSFTLGLKFDLRLALLILLPVAVLAWLPGLNLLRSRFARRLWLGYLTVAGTGLALVHLVDFAHFAYLHSRLNATVLEFLQAPDISARMVWESYPVVWAVLGLAAFALGFGWVLQRTAFRVLEGERGPRQWWGRWLGRVGFAAVVIGGIYGNASFYPLRWSEAFFTAHPLAIALGLNPVLYFFDTLGKAEEDFDRAAVERHYARVADYLGVKVPDAAALRFERRVVPRAKFPGNPNVVVIFLESFAAFKVGAFGNPLNPTPHFDALAGDGWLFKRFFVPSTGTARSIFAALFGIPDVTLNGTSSRNPLIVSQHTIITAFDDYEKFYFLGGSANWGNIRGVLSHNIPGLRLYEEGDYRSPRADVWGISDLDLFEEANAVLRARGDKPFFAVIQTAGNHRPFTIPEDNQGFEWVEPDAPNLTRLGFGSVEEFNSFRFMDHSIGHFMRLAEREAYFRNTLFVFFGDHGLPGAADHFPPGMSLHQLTQHQVPLLIYAPGLIEEGREIETIASELDLMPTLAGLVGKPYRNTTLGRDLFESRDGEERYAFILVPYVNPPPIGLVGKEFYYVIDTDRRGKLYRYLSQEPTREVQAEFPARAAEMEGLTRGLYETARYLLYHNSVKPSTATSRSPLRKEARR